LEYRLLRLVLCVYYQFTFKADGSLISLQAAVELELLNRHTNLTSD